MDRRHLGWMGFGLLAALNLAWLYRDARSPSTEPVDAAAYAACRAVVRREYADAARIPFPTADLVRVSRQGAHVVVRGFFEPKRGARPTHYRCELTNGGAAGWSVDSVVVEP